MQRVKSYLPCCETSSVGTVRASRIPCVVINISSTSAMELVLVTSRDISSARGTTEMGCRNISLARWRVCSPVFAVYSSDGLFPGSVYKNISSKYCRIWTLDGSNVRRVYGVARETDENPVITSNCYNLPVFGSTSIARLVGIWTRNNGYNLIDDEKDLSRF